MTNSPNRKKVLFLITKSNWGGAQRYVYDLATQIDKTKFESIVALGGNGELVTMLEHARIKVIKINSLNRDVRLKKEWEFAKELLRILRQEKPDILHVNSSKAGGVGTLLGRITFVPKIMFTAHGWAFNEDRPWWQKLIIKFLHWLTVIFSHRTIAVSASLFKQLNWPGVSKKIKILYPGRNIGAMYEKNEAREILANLSPSLKNYLSDTWIGSIAELHPIKQQSILIESLKKIENDLPKARLVIIGTGSEKDNLQNLINQNNLSEKVFLVGAINEAARFLKAFDLFALSSKSEAYGYVLHEAGLAGLPVVATRVGGIPEIIEDGVSGLLVPPGNPTAFASALSKILDEDKLRESLAKAHQQKMSARTLKKMVIATENLYTLD